MIERKELPFYIKRTFYKADGELICEYVYKVREYSESGYGYSGVWVSYGKDYDSIKISLFEELFGNDSAWENFENCTEDEYNILLNKVKEEFDI